MDQTPKMHARVAEMTSASPQRSIPSFVEAVRGYLGFLGVLAMRGARGSLGQRGSRGVRGCRPPIPPFEKRRKFCAGKQQFRLAA